ncbi:hypothetical protein [Dyadobacter sp. CY312]|uniref:hypothetical protein n=1 Tax=Dyadobacter sp. CY312 TaxID=2907303 RepID=UPI001F46642A|nr:hypothetical protein [Dyadobacter sp. CY312]MCE7040272.1 hypothetical protein [Dyadobacter sp. CY312]
MQRLIRNKKAKLVKKRESGLSDGSHNHQSGNADRTSDTSNDRKTSKDDCTSSDPKKETKTVTLAATGKSGTSDNIR